MEQTLVLLKPDCVHRSLVGEVTKRIEGTGLTLVASKMIRLSDSLLREHYAHLVDKPFFPDIVKFMQLAPVMAMVWEGENAVQILRDLCGVTDSTKAAKGTIRGDLGTNVQYNLIHASDSVVSASIEVARFFSPSELFTYSKNSAQFSK